MYVKQYTFPSILKEIRQVRSSIQIYGDREEKKTKLFEKMGEMQGRIVQQATIDGISFIQQIAESHMSACKIAYSLVAQVKKKLNNENICSEKLNEIKLNSLIQKIRFIQLPKENRQLENPKINSHKQELIELKESELARLSTKKLDHLQRAAKSLFVNCDIMHTLLSNCLNDLILHELDEIELAQLELSLNLDDTKIDSLSDK